MIKSFGRTVLTALEVDVKASVREKDKERALLAARSREGGGAGGRARREAQVRNKGVGQVGKEGAGRRRKRRSQ